MRVDRWSSSPMAHRPRPHRLHHLRHRHRRSSASRSSGSTTRRRATTRRSSVSPSARTCCRPGSPRPSWCSGSRSSSGPPATTSAAPTTGPSSLTRRPAAVGEPTVHRKFGMENRFPFILHEPAPLRALPCVHPAGGAVVDLGLAFGPRGSAYASAIGVFLLAADAILVSLYVFSCHSFRHLAGGGIDCYTAGQHATAPRPLAARQRPRTRTTASGPGPASQHLLADIYIRALALDVINTSTPIIGGFL